MVRKPSQFLCLVRETNYHLRTQEESSDEAIELVATRRWEASYARHIFDNPPTICIPWVKGGTGGLPSLLELYGERSRPVTVPKNKNKHKITASQRKRRQKERREQELFDEMVKEIEGVNVEDADPEETEGVDMEKDAAVEDAKKETGFPAMTLAIRPKVRTMTLAIRPAKRPAADDGGSNDAKRVKTGEA